MQRADIVSPGTKITNKGQINCILDFNGEPCDFTNHAGEMRVGGNATLKSLVNKSETEPAVGGFVEVKREFFDKQEKLLTQVPAILKIIQGNSETIHNQVMFGLGTEECSIFNKILPVKKANIVLSLLEETVY